MQKQFLITGFPRSGTTLLSSIMSRHSKITVTPESCYFDDVEPVVTKNDSLDRLLYIINKSRCSDLNLEYEKFIDNVLWKHGGHKAVFSAILSEYAKKKKKEYCGEKSPVHLIRLNVILKLYKDIKVIVIVRDGRAAIESISRMPWGHRNIAKCSGEWCYWMRQLDKFQRKYPKQITIVKYEELIDNTEREMAKIIEFIGLSFESGMLEGGGDVGTIPEWEKNWKADSAGPIQDKKEQWRDRMNKQDIAIMNSIMARELKNLGYEVENVKYSILYKVLGWLYSLEIRYILRGYIRHQKIRYGI